jgi:ABC-type sugar transport system substrate-binding protein
LSTQNSQQAQSAGTNAHETPVEGLHDHPAAVYAPPPGLDKALAELPLVEVDEAAPKRIGYLVNYSFHIWYQILIEIITRRAAQYGATVVVRDADLSTKRQVEQAKELLDQVDALILTPAATEGVEEIVRMGEERGIPIVVEANPVKGMKTLEAICDYDAGWALGEWVGKHIQKEDGQPLQILDLGLPTLRPCLMRSEGFIEGVRSVQPSAEVIASLNGEGSKIIAKREASKIFADGAAKPDVIFAMDDETGQGAYEAYLDARFDPDTVSLAGFGLAGDAEKDWLTRGGALKVSAAMFPEYVAVNCVDAVMRIHKGDQVPVRDVMPTIPMTAEMLPRFYPRIDGAWTPDFKAISAIPVKGSCTRE